MDAYYHSKSSARKWGGTWETYHPINQWMDSSKLVVPDVRHRSLYHHTLGVDLAVRIYGVTISVPRHGRDPIDVPVKQIAERHVIEDLGWLPTYADYIDGMPVKTWMSGAKHIAMDLSVLGVKEKTNA